MVPLYHAVGSAMSLIQLLQVIKTSGMWYVLQIVEVLSVVCILFLRNYGRYCLGAGNYLSDSEPAHRIETLRYLIDMCETELYGKQCVLQH